MSTNSLITPEIITREALRLLENNFVILQTVSRAQEDDFRKIGDELFVRKPNRFTSSSGATTTTQDVEEAWQRVQVVTQENVSWEFSTRDLTLTVEQYSERYIRPAVSAICHTIEQSVHDLYKKAFHSSQPAAGITAQPTTFVDLGNNKVLLTDHAAPYGDRSSMLSSAACLNLSNLIAGGTAAGMHVGVDGKVVAAQEEAKIGKFAGFMNYESQFIARHTTGVLGGTVLVDDAGTIEVTYAVAKSNTDADLSWTSTLHVDGCATDVAGWALEGDVFTIDSVYSLNPATGVSTGQLQQFVVRADATSASSETDLVISPPIIIAGPHATVDSAPANNAAVTFIATASAVHSQNLCYHKDAISFGMIPMEMPDSVVWGNTQTDNGMSIRVYKWLDGDNDKEKIRLDAMWFNEVVHHDLITRLWAG
jgi:hypothetical protein